MASKPTPGPWEVRQYSNAIGFSIWGNGVGCIAEKWYANKQNDIPIEANARLIAAAPELLEACKRAIHLCEDGGSLWEQLDKAISKAEGR